LGHRGGGFHPSVLRVGFEPTLSGLSCPRLLPVGLPKRSRTRPPRVATRKWSRRDSNLQHTDSESAASASWATEPSNMHHLNCDKSQTHREGLEPSSSGFVGRRSSNRAADATSGIAPSSVTTSNPDHPTTRSTPTTARRCQDRAASPAAYGRAVAVVAFEPCRSARNRTREQTATDAKNPGKIRPNRGFDSPGRTPGSGGGELSHQAQIKTLATLHR
jgi:hypothetical protein